MAQDFKLNDQFICIKNGNELIFKRQANWNETFVRHSDTNIDSLDLNNFVYTVTSDSEKIIKSFSIASNQLLYNTTIDLDHS